MLPPFTPIRAVGRNTHILNLITTSQLVPLTSIQTEFEISVIKFLHVVIQSRHIHHDILTRGDSNS